MPVRSPGRYPDEHGPDGLRLLPPGSRSRAKGAGHHPCQQDQRRSARLRRQRLAGATAIPVADPASSPQALADDLSAGAACAATCGHPGRLLQRGLPRHGCAAATSPSAPTANSSPAPSPGPRTTAASAAITATTWAGLPRPLRTRLPPGIPHPLRTHRLRTPPYGIDYREPPRTSTSSAAWCIDRHQDIGYNAKPSVRASCHDCDRAAGARCRASRRSAAGSCSPRADGRIHPVPPSAASSAPRGIRPGSVWPAGLPRLWGSNDSTTHLDAHRTEDFDPGRN